MDEYDLIIKSRLKFKGERKIKKKKKSRDSGCGESSMPPSQQDERTEDADNHGGWWKATAHEQICGDVAIEFLPSCYAKALSNGKIVLGQPHAPGDGPDEEEIFTALGAGANQIALKSGFGRYLTINNKNRLMGLSEAIGQLETFSPVFEDGKLALCAHNNCFISPDENSDIKQLVARSETAGPNEVCTIRLNHDPVKFSKSDQESTHSAGARLKGHEILNETLQTELSHMKKTSAKHALESLSVEEEKKRIKRARHEGQLHEALLDTRVKIKSDKYCK